MSAGGVGRPLPRVTTPDTFRIELDGAVNPYHNYLGSDSVGRRRRALPSLGSPQLSPLQTSWMELVQPATDDSRAIGTPQVLLPVNPYHNYLGSDSVGRSHP